MVQCTYKVRELVLMVPWDFYLNVNDLIEIENYNMSCFLLPNPILHVIHNKMYLYTCTYK